MASCMYRDNVEIAKWGEAALGHTHPKSAVRLTCRGFVHEDAGLSDGSIWYRFRIWMSTDSAISSSVLLRLVSCHYDGQRSDTMPDADVNESAVSRSRVPSGCVEPPKPDPT